MRYFFAIAYVVTAAVCISSFQTVIERTLHHPVSLVTVTTSMELGDLVYN